MSGRIDDAFGSLFVFATGFKVGKRAVRIRNRSTAAHDSKSASITPGKTSAGCLIVMIDAMKNACSA
jgi:hypothetical protein